MKKYIILSLLALWGTVHAGACGAPPLTYNYYMFKVCPYDDGSPDATREALAREWSRYVGRTVTPEEAETLARIQPETLDTIAHPVIAEARRRNDSDMLTYLRTLAEYCRICEDINNSWDYPTKEELSARQDRLTDIHRLALQYKGKRLAPQWRLLAVRTLFRMKQWDELTDYWQREVSKTSASVYRDMAKGFYAGALQRKGLYEEAAVIYAEMGDFLSAKRCMENPHSLSCIRRVYEQNPSSPLLNCMVQTFVNNAQETLDYNHALTHNPDMVWDTYLEALCISPVYKAEVDSFIAFANQVADDRHCPAPALWKSAAAMLHYLYADYTTAQQEIDRAMTMKGESCVMDNARAIRLLVSGKTATDLSSYSDFLAEELAWLNGKIHMETGPEGKDWKYYDQTGHYQRVRDRIVYHNLVPLYKRWNRPEVVLSLMDFYTREACLDTIPVDEALHYYHYLFEQPPVNGLDYLLTRQEKYDRNYLCERIGTKLLRLGRFEEAEQWLSRVPLMFVSQMGIAPFMAKRNYNVPNWLKRQPMGWDEEYQPNLLLNENKKIAFCREMAELTRQHEQAEGEKRKQLAYELAVRYFQASRRGDCWFLSRYGKGWNDKSRAHELDFVRIAAEFLQESKTSGSAELRMHSLYALAFVSEPAWVTEVYDYGTWESYKVIHEDSPQFAALKELHDAMLLSPAQSYVPHCDQLDLFARYLRSNRP